MSETSIREKLLMAAIRFLGTHGLGQLSQPRVAKDAGVRQSHLTYYFPHRVDLLAAVARHYTQSLARDVARMLESRSPEEARATLIAFATDLVQDKARTRIFLGLLVAADENPELRKAVNEGILTVRAAIAEALGAPSDHPDAAMIEAALWGVALQYLVLGKVGGAEPEVLVARFAEFLLPRSAAPRRRTNPPRPRSRPR